MDQTQESVFVETESVALFFDLADSLSRVDPIPTLENEGYAWAKLCRAQLTLEELEGREIGGEFGPIIKLLTPILKTYLFEKKDAYQALRTPKS